MADSAFGGSQEENTVYTEGVPISVAQDLPPPSELQPTQVSKESGSLHGRAGLISTLPHEAQLLMATATAAGLGIPGPDPGEWEEGGQSPQGPPFWRKLFSLPLPEPPVYRDHLSGESFSLPLPEPPLHRIHLSTSMCCDCRGLRAPCRPPS